jgi:cytochrome c-type biogenesis protein CcmH/NrfG
MRSFVTCLALAALTAGCALLDTTARAIDGGGGEIEKMHREAQVALDNADDQRAETLYKALARQTPSDPEVWLRLGNLYARTDHPDQAVEAYMKSASLNDRDPRVWYNLGIVRMRQAWAALMRASVTSADKDPVHAMSGDMIKSLEQMPHLSGPKPEQPAPRDKP